MRPYWLIFVASASILLLRPVSVFADPVSLLSHDPVWLRLGHYQKKFFGGFKSQINTAEFFFSANGREDPEAELRATLAAFQNPSAVPAGRILQAPACAFPARYQWLSKKLNLPPAPSCETFKEWREGIGAKSVTLVFSSAYANNPPSMFGHTLLRLNRGEGEAILNYGLNFEARIDSNDSSLLYAFKGLFGLYQGEASLSPYYMKVNEYNYSESRDLWEYDLSLSEEEVSFLLDHIWELYSSGGFTYRFLTENCSYEILALLEVAKPEWQLLPQWSLYVLPVDTLKKVNQQRGAVLAEHFRASLHSQLNAQLERLSEHQRQQRKAILRGEQSAASIADAAVMESVLTTYDYQRRKHTGDLSAKDDAIFRQVLLGRASLGTVGKSSVPVEAPGDSPLSTHDSGLLLVGAEKRNGHSLGIVGGRISLHDQLDPAAGFPAGLQVEVGKLRLSLGSEFGKFNLKLEELKIIDLLSLFPANSGELQFSWAIRSGSSIPLDFGRSDLLSTGLEVGGGLAVSLGKGVGWLYAIALVEGEWISNAPKTGRYGPVGEIGLIWKPLNRFSALGKFRSAWEANHPWTRTIYWQSEAAMAWSFSRALQLRFTGRTGGPGVESRKRMGEVGTELRWYF